MMEHRRVYLDHAASTPLHPAVFEEMMPYLAGHFFGNPSSVHHHGRQLRSAVEKARRTVAELLNCAPGELIFLSGGTEADNFVLKCSVLHGGIRRIITSPLEHHAVLHAAEALHKTHGIELCLLTPDTQGRLSLAELQALLAEKAGMPTLVALMHGNNELGNINPVAEIAALCKEYGATFHCDTVQSVGLQRLDLETFGPDYIVGAAHKFNGPQGIGFLYSKTGKALQPLICGGGQERNQRAGTENVAGIVGLAAALKHTYDHLEQKLAHLAHLKQYMWERLQRSFPGVAQNGDPDNAFPSVLNVSLPLADDEGMLILNLDIHGISASGGSACSSGAVKGSHVLAALGLPPQRALNSVRFSFGETNTVDEVDYVLEKLKLIVPAAQPA
jgi:cysteine desulfurase